jgi:hypothetical protein
MLITLMVVLLLGGSVTNSLLDYIADGRDEAKAVIVADERRKDVLDTFKKLKKRTEVQQEQVKSSGKQLASVLASADLQSADTDKAWWTYFERVDVYNADMLDLRYELREQLTRDEWERIFPAE